MPGMYGPMGRPRPEPEPEPVAPDPTGYGGETTIENTAGYTSDKTATVYMPPTGGLAPAEMYTKVDYNWLSYFSTVLDDLDQHFQKAVDGLVPLTFNPGTRFSRGREFQNEILGASGGDGIKGAALENLTHFRQAVAEMSKKVKALSTSYANSDEMSEITAERVNADMGEILGHVNLMPQITLPGGAGGSAGGAATTTDGAATA